MKKFNYYIGIDVSKLTLDVTILHEEESSSPTTVYYKIENNEKSIAHFVKKRLVTCPCEQILFCFEDTGIYALPLAYYLNDNKIACWQVAAIEIKRSKGITRGKSDKIDSKDIAFYAYTHMHKFHPSRISAKSIQQLRLLFTEREKVLKSLPSFEKTSENKDFISKDVFKIVSSINKTVVKQLKASLKRIEEKMLSIIAAEEKLKQQYGLLTSIPDIGMQTAVYLLIATKCFDAFENWRHSLLCRSRAIPLPIRSKHKGTQQSTSFS
jgi:transposase